MCILDYIKIEYLFIFKKNKMPRIIILVFIALFTKSTLCFSWGAKGHKIVVEIAKSYLDKNIEDSIHKYIGGMSFEDAALWMDVVKNDKYYEYLKPLNYITIEKDKTYVKYLGNIVSELEIIIAQLKKNDNRNKEAMKIDLKLLFHMVGELHQPLQVGYDADKEGTLVRVHFDGKETTIHDVWDNDIIESKGITLEDCMKTINGYSLKEIKDFQKIDIVAWMNSSRMLLPDVYGFKANVIDDEYVNKNALLIQKQLAIAGIRLASVLNMVFTNK